MKIFGLMANWQRNSARTMVFLYAIIGVSVVLRLASAMLQGNSIDPLPGVHDQISYDLLARRVLSGNGFSFGVDWWPATRAGEPTAHWSYLYTLYLAGIYKAFGLNPIAARIVQAVAAGVLLPWLSWRLSRRIFGSTAGLTAALISSVYGYYVFYAGALMTETFYVLAILWTFDVATRIRAAESPRAWLWVQLGLALAAAVLLRQVFLLFTPILFGWLLLSRYIERRDVALAGKSIRGILMAVAVLALTILPWTVRNYHAFGQVSLLNTSAGFAFYWGNHPIHGTSFIPILPPEGPTYGDLLPPGLASLDEVALERELLRRGIGFVKDDPQRFLLLSLSRAAEYFKFWPSSESGLASNLVRTLSFGTLLPFVAVGLWFILKSNSSAGPNGASSGWQLDFTLLVLFILSYTFVHLLSWTLVRYRLPVDAALIVVASVGIARLAKRFQTVHLAKKGHGTVFVHQEEMS